MNRRNALGILSALPAVGLIGHADAAPFKKRLRIAHITDTHIYAEKNAAQHTRTCLEKIVAMKQKPDVIFHTGDVIMDALFADKDNVAAQWKLWQQVSGDIKIPIKYSIGNHDVWGLKKTGTAPLYGKQWAVDQMHIPNRYYSFELGGWQFIVLDSNLPVRENTGYSAGIDDEQFEWLNGELKAVPVGKPVMILSHIPIFSACIGDWMKLENNEWKVSGALMHTDSKKLRDLFAQYSQVKIGISGHLHLLDTVKYDGISYLGTGAVCGNWWNDNKLQRTSAGYAVLDLYPDGTFDRYYEDFKW
ncbi:MAG: metallophosphoesterase [Sphingobacteriales bacterium]|nr:MAG: metallophosphoesterase [Sphingobacteriales bacterium]